MRNWLKGHSADFADFTRRPGAALAVLGFLLAQMSLQADLYMPYWIADTVLAPAVFWLGLFMVMLGGLWFVLPDLRRMVQPAAVREPAEPQVEAAAAARHAD